MQAESRAAQALCPDPAMFTDSVTLHMNTREVMELTGDKWIVEIGELAGMGKADIEHVKAMLSRQCDESRMSYGRYREEQPRQFIFVGTTNEPTYLIDETGNRRYLPVKVGEIDIEALKRDRDQLWEEAAACEAKGEAIYIRDAELTETLKTAQRDREIHDVLEGKLAEWLDKKFPEADDELARMTGEKVQETTIGDAVEGLIEKGQRGNSDSATQKRIARCMRKRGWGRGPKRTGSTTGCGSEKLTMRRTLMGTFRGTKRAGGGPPQGDLGRVT